MQAINNWAVAISALVAFFASAVYYIAFAKQRAKLSTASAGSTGRPRPVQMLAELTRNLILALALAYLIQHLAIANLMGAIRITSLLWVAFPLILLSGSVMYEKIPWKLAAIHAGDWLIKLLIMSTIISLWR